MPKNLKKSLSSKKSTPKDVKTINSLIEAGQLDTAKVALEEFFIQPLSRDEHGAVYVDLLSSYMDIVNASHKEYIESLKTAITHVKEIQEREKKMNQSIDLAEVRTQLSS